MLKRNFKFVLGIIIGVILTSGVVAYATTMNAKNIEYKDGKSIEYALNELYSQGKIQKNLVFPNGSGNDIILSFSETDSINVYGIK